KDPYDYQGLNVRPNSITLKVGKPMDEILPIPESLGAARTPDADLKMGMADLDALTRRLAYHPGVLGRVTNDMLTALNHDPLLNNPGASARISGAVDRRDIGSLGQEDMAAYEYWKPLQEANEQLYGELRAMGGD